MVSPTQWTWVWINSRSWWWTGRPGVLRYMGSQRVGHDWVTELYWTLNCLHPIHCKLRLHQNRRWALRELERETEPLPSSSQLVQSPLNSACWGDSGWVNTRHWAQIAEVMSKAWFQWAQALHLSVHRKALILLTWDVWFSLINSNRLLFQLPGLCCKNSYISWPLFLLLPLCIFGAVPQSSLRFLSSSLGVLRMSTQKNITLNF